MQRPVRVVKNRDGVSVLAGDRQITEMLVFLLYRKLKNMTSVTAARAGGTGREYSRTSGEAAGGY